MSKHTNCIECGTYAAPPTPADRLADVKACALIVRDEWRAVVIRWNDAALTALLAADPPGATVDIVCKCGHGENEHVTPADTDGLGHPHPYCGPCVSADPLHDEDACAGCCHGDHTFTPTTARVLYERALTEEKRNV